MRFANNIKYIFCLLLAVLLSQLVQAQYAHYLNNYTLYEYKAGNQNWDIAKAADGKLWGKYGFYDAFNKPKIGAPPIIWPLTRDRSSL